MNTVAVAVAGGGGGGEGGGGEAFLRLPRARRPRARLQPRSGGAFVSDLQNDNLF